YQFHHFGTSYLKPGLFIKCRSEAKSFLAKHAVGAIFLLIAYWKYVDEKNRETSVAARKSKPQ
ncbi:MAG: hypothetical protein U9N45_08065, partial [Gemmatimonadota bacterium]|nr:hypothetical protein [Gemmatimonadota bacterium]